MNCKQGDLAVVVQSVAGNEGKIVRCVKYAGLVTRTGPFGIRKTQHCWITDPGLPGWNGDISPFSADEQLRPLRDNEGEDETLTWAGKPQEVKA